MKLRNKKTGEIIDLVEGRITDSGYGSSILLFPVATVNESYAYTSLAELNEDWEDYKPKEPLIKNEKIRKAVRAWLSIQEQPMKAIAILCRKDSDGFFCYHLYGYIDEARIADGKAVANNNLTAISFEFRGSEKIEFDPHRDYTIAELCGEEEE